MLVWILVDILEKIKVLLDIGDFQVFYEYIITERNKRINRIFCFRMLL